MTVWAFLDESGDLNLEVENGASTHFTVAAVVVEDANLAEVRAAVEGVRQRYFQTGPMKSRTVGSQLQRRLLVLRALEETGYHTLGLIVDKRRLDRGSGLRFRSSFMKRISRSVYERLFKAYPVLRVRADRHGRPAFMDSFEEYLKGHCAQLGLFETPPELVFVDSASEVLVQAADFVAGSLRIAYADDTTEADAREILSALGRPSLGLHEWPARPRAEAALPTVGEASNLDGLVRRAAERSAYAFLADVGEEEDETSRMQVEILQDLLGAVRFENSPYVNGDELAERLRERGYQDCTRDVVRRQLIAPMRDREVLIVSSNRGYSLASSLADVETHLGRMEDEVRPILRRVQKMDAQLKRISVGRLDVLRGDRFRCLRELLSLHGALDLSAGAADAGTPP